MAELAEFLGKEDTPCERDDHVCTLEERNIEGIALGVALLGPVTAIQRNQS
jgi:hypothetical protein